MKTSDEIKKGLFCCWEDGCSECPYDDDCTMEANFEQLAKDALAYIQQLEATISQVSKALCGKENADLDELLQTVSQLEWISVKDRLPEESDGTVLVCFPNKSPYNLREHFVNAKHDQRVRTACYSQYSNTWYIGDMCGVGGEDPTHWMPLPEPPKEE